MAINPTVSTARASSKSSRVGPLYASASSNIEEEQSSGDAKKESEAQASQGGIKFGPYSWFVLSIILGIRVLY